MIQRIKLCFFKNRVEYEFFMLINFIKLGSDRIRALDFQISLQRLRKNSAARNTTLLGQTFGSLKDGIGY